MSYPADQGSETTHDAEPMRQDNTYADLFESVKAVELMLAVALLGVIWLLISLFLSLEVLPR